MTSKQKAFIILTPGFAESETDTNCLPMQQSFVKSLSKLYPDINIIVLSFQYPFSKRTYQWFNATVMSCNGRNKGGLQGIFLRSRISKLLERLHETYQLMGILSFWLGECAYVGKKFSEKNDIKHYCWLMGQDAKANNKYTEKISFRANELIALSDFLQEEFGRNYNIKPFAVIPPGIEANKSTQSARDIDLLAVGSLIPLKQFEIFVETVATVREQHKNIKAVLIGDGPQRARLGKLILDYNLENNIMLTGKIENEQVLKMMQRTKILLHPSSYEGFSGVCQEALVNGAHVISFCRAMNKDIPKWHIVKSKEQMSERVLSIFENSASTFNKIVFPSMDATAKTMMDYYLQWL
ncbi:MAG TPA: glycosyltransferase family 4 protein [Flavisolibacter sp.]|jgi:glycosyltransferase involved in cell wall biosynthesis|nr:glycosyltransferase family 4 protein [Flavisolibacter sp.]